MNFLFPPPWRTISGALGEKYGDFYFDCPVFEVKKANGSLYPFYN